jgi:hypothetical protein
LQEIDAGDGIHRQYITGDDLALADHLLYRNWLQPPGAAPRSTTVIPALSNLITAWNSSILKHSTRTQAFFLRFLYIFIVKMFFEPAGRAGGAFLLTHEIIALKNY